MEVARVTPHTHRPQKGTAGTQIRHSRTKDSQFCYRSRCNHCPKRRLWKGDQEGSSCRPTARASNGEAERHSGPSGSQQRSRPRTNRPGSWASVGLAQRSRGLPRPSGTAAIFLQKGAPSAGRGLGPIRKLPQWPVWGERTLAVAAGLGHSADRFQHPWGSSHGAPRAGLRSPAR